MLHHGVELRNFSFTGLLVIPETKQILWNFRGGKTDLIFTGYREVKDRLFGIFIIVIKKQQGIYFTKRVITLLNIGYWKNM
jgi:hypothetical protein